MIHGQNECPLKNAKLIYITPSNPLTIIISTRQPEGRNQSESNAVYKTKHKKPVFEKQDAFQK